MCSELKVEDVFTYLDGSHSHLPQTSFPLLEHCSLLVVGCIVQCEHQSIANVTKKLIVHVVTFKPLPSTHFLKTIQATYITFSSSHGHSQMTLTSTLIAPKKTERMITLKAKGG